nr:hypothetical protein [uncultured Ilyobacter sp.]
MNYHVYGKLSVKIILIETLKRRGENPLFFYLVTKVYSVKLEFNSKDFDMAMSGMF